MIKMEIKKVFIPNFPQNFLKQEKESLMGKSRPIKNRNLKHK